MRNNKAQKALISKINASRVMLINYGERMGNTSNPEALYRIAEAMQEQTVAMQANLERLSSICN